MHSQISFKNPFFFFRGKKPFKPCKNASVLFSSVLSGLDGLLVVMGHYLAGIGVDMAHFGVYLCIIGQAAALELAVDHIGKEGIYKHEHGNAQQHTHKAEQAAAHDDGKHYPEAVDAHAVAEDLGTKEVTVKLLKQNNKYDKSVKML